MSEASDDRAVIPFVNAVATWAAAWIFGGLVLGALAIAAMGASFDEALSIPETAVVAAVGWAVFVGALIWASGRYASGDPIADFAVSFRPIDLIGIPVGVAAQLVLVDLVYLPLRAVWPDTFSDERIEENARQLVDAAGGWRTVVLFVLVVVGAPLVEELVYRGMIQRSASALIGLWPGLVMTSIWFALIHFRPVEYPGLFVVGLLFGGGLVLTGRLGASILTHAAFNAAGLIDALANT